VSSLDDAADVDAGVRVQRAPDEYRQVEQQRLHEQDHRYPLVVGDHRPLVRLVLPGHVLVERQVVRVADPAVVVGVLLVVAGEVRRDPAADRVADELLGGDDQREDDEDRRRVAVRQPVGEVVVLASLNVRHAADHSHDLVHRCSSSHISHCAVFK